MSVTGGIVTFAVLWFVCLLVILPRGVPTQLETGKVVPGTPGGAPASIRIWRKFLWTTVVTFVIWLILFVIMTYELITLRDLDFIVPQSLRAPPA